MSISVSSNSDGTFTVTCGTETVIIGASNTQTTSSASKPVGGRAGRVAGKVVGGFVVCSIVPNTTAPCGAIQARNASDLANKLKLKVSAATIARAAGDTKPKEVHFALNGRHTVDFGKLSAITGGDSSGIITHIHIGRHRG
jgi:hypothetical protein